MTNKTLSLVAIGLLLVAGCSAPGGSSRSRLSRRGLLPGKLASKSSDKAFARAVEKDPFPKAASGNVQVAVSK
jgi:hypothetical protein